MKKEQFLKLLEEIAEKEDISLNAFEKQEDKTYFIEFEYWSDLGEDVIISLNIEKLTKDEILHEMWIFSESFDADEHAEMLLTNQVIFKTKKGEFIGIIMPIVNNFKLNDFELLPDIIEEKEENPLTIEEAEKINTEIIKAEAEEEENIDLETYLYYLEQKEHLTKKYKSKLKKWNKEHEQKRKNEERKNVLVHINYVTQNEYTKGNITILDAAMKQYNYSNPVWMGSFQAKQKNLQLKKINHPVTIFVYSENEKGDIYKSYQNVYNIDDFEPIKKIEETTNFKDLVNELIA